MERTSTAHIEDMTIRKFAQKTQQTMCNGSRTSHGIVRFGAGASRPSDTYVRCKLPAYFRMLKGRLGADQRLASVIRHERTNS
jgi:hypothetical protein